MIAALPAIADAIISGVSSLAGDAAGPSVTSAIGADKPKVSFADTLKAAIDGVDKQVAVASGAAASYAAGNHAVPLSSVMVSMEKANLAFQTATAVRDHITEAYNSIMNMQV